MTTNNSQALSVEEMKARLQRKYPGIRYFPSQRPGWGYIDVPRDDEDSGGFDVEAGGLMSDVCDSEDAAWKSAFEKDQAIQAYARTRHGPSPEPSDAEIREQATWLIYQAISANEKEMNAIQKRIEDLLRTEAAYKRGGIYEPDYASRGWHGH